MEEIKEGKNKFGYYFKNGSKGKKYYYSFTSKFSKDLAYSKAQIDKRQVVILNKKVILDVN